MYEINYAYFENDEECAKLSPEDLVRRLFEKTDDMGVLLVPDHPYRRGRLSEGRKWLRCEMGWTGPDCEEIAGEIADLLCALGRIAGKAPELGFSPAEDRELLSEEDLKVYRKYCADIGDGLFEKEIENSIDMLIDRTLFPVPDDAGLTGRAKRKARTRHRVDMDPVPADEELFIYWKHNMELKSDIRAKIGPGPFAFDICIRAKRSYYLMALNAPESLTEREAKRLAVYIVLDRFCRRHSNIELVDAYGLPLTGIRNVELVRDILADIRLYDIVDPEDDFDPAVINWDSIRCGKASYGEELIEAFDLFWEYEPGAYIIAEELARREDLNKDKIEFFGEESSAIMGCGWPDFIFCPVEQIFAGHKVRTDLSGDEILDTLRRFARELGIDPELAGRYMIP